MSASDFAGTWNFVSSDNFDNYLKQVGVGLVTRKLASNLKPTLVFEIDGDKWKMSSLSTFKNIVTEFELDKEFDETTGDGRKVKSTFSLKDGKLIQIQKATKDSEKDSTFERYIEGGKLIIKMQSDDVVATRVYEKAQ
uniref:FABP domain-containing protein n=1 Tax=Panagrellus redivivus TaxID=6233 RepID=A0A7E4ZRD7_PANRE